tara:strand:- start:993 stop:2186 length:1194 start_codon:yes stop_codon:yes gene_type:complete
MKLYKKEKKELTSSLVNYLIGADEYIDTNVLVSKINDTLSFNEQFRNPSEGKKISKKLMITTGCGNTIEGGADIWTNHFIENIWKSIKWRKHYKLLIDSKRPVNFDPNSLPADLQWHFHGDDPSLTKDLLEECSEIIYLHSHYHKREHIWKYENKFKLIFVHAYPTEMEEVLNHTPELKRLQFNTKVDSRFYNEFLQTFDKRIWIGNNPSKLIDDFPNYTYSIPNFYEFIHNIPYTDNLNNEKIGFASRAETRKCMHWMHGHDGYILSSKYDYQNLKDSTSYTFPNIKFFQWNKSILDSFMTKDFGIFHGAYFKEPFGYSIFQAIDYGKLPIIHTDWAKDVDYKYRASTKNEFDKCIKKIKGDSFEERYTEFAKLKTYMMQFDNRKQWSHKVLKYFS